MSDRSKTIYGDKNPGAPSQLDTFAFLIGKWEGKGKTTLENGEVAEFPVTWIGRWVLDGLAIADEAHSVGPDGRPYLGISFRHYDSIRATWIVEYLNVSHSFLRKQVNTEAGSVSVNGRTVTVSSESPGISVREHYHVADAHHWIFRLDVSNDGGKSWNKAQMEMTFQRVE